MNEATIHWKIRGQGEGLARAGLWLFMLPTLSLILYFMCLLSVPAFMDMTLGGPESAEGGSAAALFFIPGMMVGLAAQYAGLGMVLWALMVSKCRARWFYGWMQFATVLTLISSPGGIVLAVVVSRYLYYHKAEFYPSASSVPPLPFASAAPPQPGRADGLRAPMLEDENARLKAIVADQALEIQRLKS